VQSNAVIWVEGPSDRIYLQHWLKSLAPELVEGIHHSIMFYGGRLLSHLGADDDELTEFIGLRALNQNLAIIIDSDRPSIESSINETKARVIREFEKGKSIGWVTAGREIENYIDHSALQRAVQAVHSGKYGEPANGGQFDHALFYKAKDSGDIVKKGIDKVKVARKVCEAPANLAVLDLKERLDAIVAMIRSANF
jgi:hypothetical protein